MPDNASRRGATDLGMPLMILAFVVIGGFLFWLNGQAADERALQVVEDSIAAAADAEDDDDGVQVVAASDIQMDATPFEGQEIRLVAVNVASLLGSQGFWLEMPNGNPFLVSMGPDVVAAGVSVSPGSPATVTGTVMTMNDSTLTAWTDAGTIAEGDRIVAEFATHFVHATTVRTPAGSGGGADEGEGSSGSN